MKYMITNKGLILASKVNAGAASLHLTKAEAGSSYYTNPLNLEAIDAVQTISIENVTNLGDAAVISLTLFNQDITSEYMLRQIGIYAADPDEGEILFIIGQNQTGELVPAFADMPAEFNYQVSIKTSNASEVTFDMAGETFVKKKYLKQEVEYPEYTEAEILENLVSGENHKTALGKIARAVTDFITHITKGTVRKTYTSVTVDENGHVISGSNPTTLSGYGITDAVNTSEKGTANGVASLGSDGRVPSTQLPSYVDDVIEGYLYSSRFYQDTAHTKAITGETGKIYVDLSTNKTYRWSGSAFAVISETLALGETSSTAYRGDRGKIAYNHSQAAHAPSGAEVNQKAYSAIKLPSGTLSAVSKTDTFEIKADTNVELTEQEYMAGSSASYNGVKIGVKTLNTIAACIADTTGKGVAGTKALKELNDSLSKISSSSQRRLTSPISVPSGDRTKICQITLIKGTYVLIGHARWAGYNAEGYRAIGIFDSDQQQYPLSVYDSSATAKAIGTTFMQTAFLFADVTQESAFYLMSYQNSGNAIVIDNADIMAIRLS